MITKYLPLIFLVGALLVLAFNPLKESGFGTSSDEGYYYRYAQKVSIEGRSGFSALISWYHDNTDAREHPAPVRVGYIGSLAVLFKVFGPSYTVIGLFSTLCFLLFVWLNLHAFRKHFTEKTAVLMTLLLTTSPLLLGLSRRALVDVPICLLWAMAFWSFLEYVQTRAGKWLFMFGGSLSLGILFKESTVLLFPVFLLLTFFLKSWYKKDVDLKIILVVLLAAACGAFMLLWLILGNGQVLLKGMSAVISTHTQISALNPYAVYYSSGPWHRYLIDFFLLSPIIVLLSVGYVFFILVQGKASWQETALLLFFVGVYVMFSLFPHSKVIRFVAILELTFSVFAVRGVEELLGKSTRISRIVSPETVICLLACVNMTTFGLIFYQYGLLDPITGNLAAILGFIPLH